MSLRIIESELMLIKAKNNEFAEYCFGRDCNNCKISEHRREKRKLGMRDKDCEDTWDSIIAKQNNVHRYR